MAVSKSVHQCDICLERGDSNVASGYCENCDEHLCEDCFNYHKKPKKFRDHIIFRIQETGRQIRRREYDVTSEKCKVHANYFVEFYCEDHNQVGCANCHLKDHKRCENITDLREINRDVHCSSQVNDCRTALRELDQDAEAIESEVRQNEEKIRVTSTECLEKIEQFRHEINENVDKLETQVADDVKKANVDRSQVLNSVSGSCEVVRGKIKERISEIERYEENGHACRMYVALKGLNEDIVSIRTDLRKARSTNHVKLYTFNPDRQLKSSIFEDVERFGILKEVVDGSEEECGTVTKDIKILTKKEKIDDLQQQLKEKTTLADKYEKQVKDVTVNLEKRIKDKEKRIKEQQQELEQYKTNTAPACFGERLEPSHQSYPYGNSDQMFAERESYTGYTGRRVPGQEENIFNVLDDGEPTDPAMGYRTTHRLVSCTCSICLQTFMKPSWSTADVCSNC